MIIAIWSAYAFFDRQFRISNIKGKWPEVNFSSVTDKQLIDLEEIFLSRSFRYLDRGKQSFVFASQDGRYVLKFFDARCLRSGDHPFLFPIDEEQCAKKLQQLFKGYQLAAARSFTHGGLVFLQLNVDSSYVFYTTVVDRFGIEHTVNLAEVPFVIQQRGIALRDLMTMLLKEGNVNEAKNRLRKIVDMYLEGYQEGVLDLDHNFLYNTGFVDDYPMRIDLGRVTIDEEIKNPKFYLPDLEKMMIIRLGKWLERYFPKYQQEILEDMKLKLQEVIFNETLLMDGFAVNN